MKLIRSPLMREPSWSWSVMIMIWPYLKLLRSSSDVYFLLYWRPTILIRLLISAFSSICNHTHKHTKISDFKFYSELSFMQAKVLQNNVLLHSQIDDYGINHAQWSIILRRPNTVSAHALADAIQTCETHILLIQQSFYLLNARSIFATFLCNWMQCVGGLSF